MHIAWQLPKARIQTHSFNTCCFSTATMINVTCFIVMLHVHCLYCFLLQRLQQVINKLWHICSCVVIWWLYIIDLWYSDCGMRFQVNFSCLGWQIISLYYFSEFPQYVLYFFSYRQLLKVHYSCWYQTGGCQMIRYFEFNKF